MQFILINVLTHCARRVSEDEIRIMIDARHNPGGYTDVDTCMAMIKSPNKEAGGFIGFPFRDSHGNNYTIHVDGRLDYPGQLRYQPADHRCNKECVLRATFPEKERRIIEVVKG